MVTTKELLTARYGKDTGIGDDSMADPTIEKILSRHSLRAYKDEPVSDELLDVLDQNVAIPDDLVVLDGMVADQLAHAAPYEGVHSKLLIDASTSRKQGAPDISLDEIEGVSQYRWIRPSMLVITTKIEGGPSESKNTEHVDEEASQIQRDKIFQLRNSIWQLDNSNKELSTLRKTIALELEDKLIHILKSLKLM